MIDTPDILSEADYRRISEQVYRHCGINLGQDKKDLVRARLAKQLRVKGFRRTEDYLDYLAADSTGEAFRDLVDSLSTNLTSFFREMAHFDFLTSRFLPELIARKQRKNDHRIRVWSAGCSTGEEPYSLTITLLEALAGASGWDLKLLATDISRRVLRSAMEGVYDKKRIDSVPPMLRGRYFSLKREDHRTTYTVTPAVRELIRFRYLNLLEPWPFAGPFDFIFCRNVMIYFDKPTQQKVIAGFWECLAAGGLLFTGHSESLTGVSHRFRYLQPTIYVKS